jgi:hypothetical protein
MTNDHSLTKSWFSKETENLVLLKFVQYFGISFKAEMLLSSIFCSTFMNVC